MTPAQLEQQRDRIYRRARIQRIRTMDEAAHFIDTVGFCLLFASTQGIELPSLFEAVKGRRDAHIEDWDADSDRVWVWKNDLPAAKRAYYGKALVGGKPVFISLKMLPCLYALHATENVDEEYARGRLGLEAKRVYDTLRAVGPTPSKALRAAAGFDRAEDNNRYHRALDELQRSLVILPVGATLETGAWPSQIFDLVARWYPAQVARAQKLDADRARRALVKRYVQTVVAAKPPMIARVFGWSRQQIDETVADLVTRRVLKLNEDWIVAE
ncbi:MAG: winged helix DNA-binding domain-containing protein [Chloroflexi bacterium]|nr:winged helix DNA-binding domain-containing protein [Chloroflexota bacterium]